MEPQATWSALEAMSTELPCEAEAVRQSSGGTNTTTTTTTKLSQLRKKAFVERGCCFHPQPPLRSWGWAHHHSTPPCVNCTTEALRLCGKLWYIWYHHTPVLGLRWPGCCRENFFYSLLFVDSRWQQKWQQRIWRNSFTTSKWKTMTKWWWWYHQQFWEIRVSNEWRYLKIENMKSRDKKGEDVEEKSSQFNT